jgi:hypothetical protein
MRSETEENYFYNLVLTILLPIASVVLYLMLFVNINHVTSNKYRRTKFGAGNEQSISSSGTP